MDKEPALEVGASEFDSHKLLKFNAVKQLLRTLVV
jgi:hypothetical protein